jgi:hypothetical protein
MKYNVKILFVAVVASATALSAHAANDSPSSVQSGNSALQAQDLGQQISFGQLPQPAKKMILQHSRGTIPKDVRSMKQNGKQYYSATFDHGQTKGRVTVAPDGSMVALQESTVFAGNVDLSKAQKSQMGFDQLPQPVQQRIKQEAGTSPVGNLSKTEVNGQPLYRADFSRDGVRHEMFLTPQGAVAVQVQKTTVVSNVRFDVNGNIVPEPGQEINEAAGAQTPSEEKFQRDYE